MRTFFTLLAAACSILTMAAAPAVSGINPEQNIKITGVVQDSVTGKPVEFATVALLDPATDKPIDGTICDENGKFTLNRVAPGKYKISVTFIGFEPRVINVMIDDKKDLDLGMIIISPVAQVLKEVTVEGQRAIIEERVDRTVYNAENDATAKGGDATDVLKRVPLLSVDIDGNVSLRGNQNILVLINNKPSSIMASSVADALKQIPADEIKTVEVITSPSAKYDAEGSAGIINIVTKKNNLQGLTLNINSGVGLRGSNLGLNGNYRRGKMGFSLGGWGRANYNVNGSFENEQTTGDITNLQRGNTRSNGLFGNYNIGWDYDINKKNTLAASVRFGIRNNNSFQDQLQQFTNGSLTRLQDVINEGQSNSVDASLTYTRLYDKPQRELSFQGQYGRNNNNSVFENFFFDVNDFSDLNRFKNFNDSYNEEMTVQVDYQTPVGDNQMIEFGGKNIMRRVFSDFTSFTANSPGEAYIPSSNSSYSNNLNYDQNVTAGYLAYTYASKAGYSLKAGSRYEYTTISAYTRTDDNIVIPSYGIIVPSVNVAKKLRGGNMVKASYNRRIQRPSIRFLNPNIQRFNNLSITVGNPELDPEYTNNYELSYSTFIKGTTINLSGFFRNTNDGIQSVRDTTELDGEQVIRTTYQNIGLENAYGSSIFANVTIGRLSLNGGGDVYYATLDNKNPNPELRASNEGWVVSGRVFGNFSLEKGWGLQFFSFMRGRNIELQGTRGGFYMYSLAVRKEFNEKRGSIGVGLENFLAPSIKIKSGLESPVLVQRSVNTINNMSFRINFSYRIGKMTMEDRPRGGRGGINNDDLKMGDTGDMQMGPENGGMPMGGGGGRNQGPQLPRPSAEAKMPVATDSVVYRAPGTWMYTVDSPQGGGGAIVITEDNGTFSGTIKSDRMRQETPFTSVTVNKNEVKMSYTMSFGGNTVPVELSMVIVGEGEMQGTMSFGQSRTLNIAAKKSN